MSKESEILVGSKPLAGRVGGNLVRATI